MLNFSSLMSLHMKINTSVFRTMGILVGPEHSMLCYMLCYNGIHSLHCQLWCHLTAICDSGFQHSCIAQSDWALHGPVFLTKDLMQLLCPHCSLLYLDFRKWPWKWDARYSCRHLKNLVVPPQQRSWFYRHRGLLTFRKLSFSSCIWLWDVIGHNKRAFPVLYLKPLDFILLRTLHLIKKLQEKSTACSCHFMWKASLLQYRYSVYLMFWICSMFAESTKTSNIMLKKQLKTHPPEKLQKAVSAGISVW